MHRKALFIAALLSLQGCASISKGSQPLSTLYSPDTTDVKGTAWQHLSGTWKGETDVEDGARYQWVITRDPHGHYENIGMITHTDGRSTTTIEYGRWAYDSGIYFSIYDGYYEKGSKITRGETPPYGWNAYDVLRLDDSSFHYRTRATGDSFVQTKVLSSH